MKQKKKKTFKSLSCKMYTSPGPPALDFSRQQRLKKIKKNIFYIQYVQYIKPGLNQ